MSGQGPDGWSDFELAIGSTHGVRAFSVDELGRLTAVYKSHVWRPDENVAKCSLGSRHVAPHPDCTCGFYAFYTDQSDHEGNGEVVGVIEGYGKTVVGDKGFRCEKAKLVGLYIPGYRAPKAATKTKAVRRRRQWTWRYGRLYKSEGASFAAWMFHSIVATVSLCLGIVNAISGNTGLALTFFFSLFVNIALAVSVLLESGDRTSTHTSQSERYYSESQRRRMALTMGLYANVPMFESRRDLMKAFPLKNSFAEMKPDPSTDPDFWKR